VDALDLRPRRRGWIFRILVSAPPSPENDAEKDSEGEEAASVLHGGDGVEWKKL
jgi:hypothetical protein